MDDIRYSGESLTSLSLGVQMQGAPAIGEGTTRSGLWLQERDGLVTAP